MPAEQRTFECVACGLLIDRDHNAARNILQWGRDSVPRSERRQRFAERICERSARGDGQILALNGTTT